VLTCTIAKDTGEKLCAWFEHSSTQQLKMLIELFFQAQRDCKEDISMHVAKLQKLFVDLNDELAKYSENILSELMLTGRILSTLGKEYDCFKDVWDTIPTSPQMVNLLIEKLCAIELQDDKLALAEAMAFSAHENDKKLNSMTVNSSNSMKGGADRAKQKFPCNKCDAHSGHHIQKFSVSKIAIMCPICVGTKTGNNLSCENQVVSFKI